MAVIVGLNQIRLDALQEPGKVETFLATVVKEFLVRRSSREGIPPPPSNSQESIASHKCQDFAPYRDSLWLHADRLEALGIRGQRRGCPIVFLPMLDKFAGQTVRAVMKY